MYICKPFHKISKNHILKLYIEYNDLEMTTAESLEW